MLEKMTDNFEIHAFFSGKTKVVEKSSKWHYVVQGSSNFKSVDVTRHSVNWKLRAVTGVVHCAVQIDSNGLLVESSYS